MQKKLTITIHEQVYKGLHEVIGRGKISRFLEDLARPLVIQEELEASYEEMAKDDEREKEAVDWVDNLSLETFDETR